VRFLRPLESAKIRHEKTRLTTPGQVAPRPSELTENVDPTQESAEVTGKSNDHGGEEFQGQVVTWKRGTCGSTPPKMDPSNQPDEKTGGAPQRDVEQQQSLRFLSC
jgi:hypothetical protein